MPSLKQHQKRRGEFLAGLDNPVLLMAGGNKPRNYPDNPFPYRPDSSFLFFFGEAEADSAAFFDPRSKQVHLFLPARSPEGALWYGDVPSFGDMQARLGVDAVDSIDGLEEKIASLAKGRSIDALAVADPKASALASRITGQDLNFDTGEGQGRADIVLAIAALRSSKDREELDEMRRTAVITKEAHLDAMGFTRPGILEQELAGRVDGCFARHGCVPAYNTILSVRGEVLHNHEHHNELRDGDIVLLDGGAEAASGYCSDVTRCWPVSGKFSAEGAEIYDIVLASELAAIEQVKAGMRYGELHRAACMVIAEGLSEMGVLRGKAEDLVETGAHALFFPHGVGHQIGLDVHDMEAFGDQVHYPANRSRSAQFGTKFLRTDTDLKAGMTFTIEPGIYFVPAILYEAGFREQFKDQVNWDQAEKFLRANDGRGFGGIRIEDDVLATEDGYEVLTAAIPKGRQEVQDLVGSALS
ncbi:MAG: aminopeptidase P family protein [Planctomycetota bacterium]|jgi:Xaa-Pro aminopeptidase